MRAHYKTPFTLCFISIFLLLAINQVGHIECKRKALFDKIYHKCAHLPRQIWIKIKEYIEDIISSNKNALVLNIQVFKI